MNLNSDQSYLAEISIMYAHVMPAAIAKGS